MKSLYSGLLGAALLAGLVVPQANAQVPSVDLAEISASVDVPLDLSKNGPMSHIDPALRTVHQALQTNASARLARGYVTVDIVASSAESAPDLEAELVRAGFQPTGRIGALISGFLPVPAIGNAAKVPTLRTMLASRSTLRRAGGTQAAPLVIYPSFAGAVEGEASKALGADEARDTYGINGSGITIGVLSDSYNALGGAAADVASGDLPAGILVLEDLTDNADEGRAMMQLAYDVAPGAKFAFHTAFGGLASYAQGIVDLYNAGANVIVDDVTNGTEPYFQDGLVSQAIDYVASQGVPYFTAAGNEAAESYEGDYIDSETDLVVDDQSRGTLHDFDTSGGVDLFLNVTLPPGEKLSFGFGYDEPSAAAAGDGGSIFVGAPGQAPTSDYDVYVLDTPSATATAANVLAVSDFDNPTTGLPYESIEYTNTTGSDQTVYIAFTKLTGVPRRLKFSNGGGSGEALKAAEYVGASTALGHANAVGAFTLAATPFFDTAAFNPFIADNEATAGPAAVASSSSIGGGRIYLDVDGNRLATPVDRMKPDATSSDADNNTFFGDDTTEDSDALPNFFGTSAAAPNAAAVAALMIESAGGPGTITPIEIYDALRNTAADLKPGDGYNELTTPGYDIYSGLGLIQASAAVAAVAAPLCSPASSLAFSSTFDTNGDHTTFGEFVTIQEQGVGAANLIGCTFAVFDPMTEEVIYSTEVTGVVATEGSLTFATMNGDRTLPASTIPDGPGAFTLLDGPATVGQDVSTVLASADVVAGVVYQDENNVFASIGGGTTANNNDAFLNGLRQIFVASESGAEVDLSVIAAPNPVSENGSVVFGLATGGDVRVALYDALGRQVALLAEGPYETGRHTVTFQATSIPAGVYIVRIEAEEGTRTSRLTVVR